MNTLKIIEFNNVNFNYGAEPTLIDVNFSIKESELVSIIGPNGGGKTTILRLILAILKPKSGTIKVLNNSPVHSRIKIGYVPQYVLFDTQFPVTVYETVLMGRVHNMKFGFFSKTDKELSKLALEEVGLYEMRNKSFSELSGGQRQRVLIARSIATEPKILLLDEPTSNMDKVSAQNLYDLLKDFSSKMTILWVSHDIGVVSSIVTTVLCVNKTISIHPTSNLTGELINSMYGGKMSIIQHHHNCSEKGHNHARISN